MKEFKKSLFAKTMYYIIHVISAVVFVATIIFEIVIGLLGFYEMAPESIYLYLYKYYTFTEIDSEFLWGLIWYASAMRFWVYGITILAFVIMVASLVMLISATGKKRGDDEIHTLLINKIPTDIFITIIVAVYCVMIAAADALLFYIDYGIRDYLGWVGLVLLAVAAIMIEPFVFTGIAIRIKNKTLFKNSMCYIFIKLLLKPIKWLWKQTLRFIEFLKEATKNISLVWRTVLILTVVSLMEFFVLLGSYGDIDILMPLWIVEKMIIIPAVIYAALTLRKLETAGQKIAEGDTRFKLDLKGLYWQFRKHGENLNSISDGIKNAVSHELKSERMKTELITNVSHDIKTPLTSIINYATLISEEDCDNEKIKEYSEVLVRQSDRLKRLTEDLVEASKASTGNIDVDLVSCDPSIFVTQADGEYAEKLAKANLSLITKVPDEEVAILADGRRMWRVFDNLMNNICKYALEGTRVYLSLEIAGKDAVFNFKNTSREMLDISEDELMERFVRGDKSRNTEGNGLGLSIAKSMAEVQGGRLEISIDGDLFKATLTFPIITE